MARIGVGHSERGRVSLEGLREGLARQLVAPGHVGDQGAVIALIVLRPIGAAQRVERGERIAMLAVGLLHPGAGERRGEIGDGALAGGGEMLLRLLVVGLLEGLEAEHELGDAMRRLDGGELVGELDGAIPMRRGGLKQEGLLEDDLVLGVVGERLGVELGRGQSCRGRRAPRGPKGNCREGCRNPGRQYRPGSPRNRRQALQGSQQGEETSTPICAESLVQGSSCCRLGYPPPQFLVRLIPRARL